MAEINSETLNSLASKLEGFAEGLSAEERAALGGVIARAEAADADEDEVEKFQFRTSSLNFASVQAPALRPGLASQLGNSLGRDPGNVALDITVSWGW